MREIKNLFIHKFLFIINVSKLTSMPTLPVPAATSRIRRVFLALQYLSRVCAAYNGPLYSFSKSFNKRCFIIMSGKCKFT